MPCTAVVQLLSGYRPSFWKTISEKVIRSRNLYLLIHAEKQLSDVHGFYWSVMLVGLKLWTSKCNRDSFAVEGYANRQQGFLPFLRAVQPSAKYNCIYCIPGHQEVVKGREVQLNKGSGNIIAAEQFSESRSWLADQLCIALAMEDTLTLASVEGLPVIN